MGFDADLVIIGGGCAGLSLAARLAATDLRRRVVVLEPRTEYADDRSWCFWRPDVHDLSGLVSRSWTRWRFSSDDGRSVVHSSPGMSYHYIRALDFYAASRVRIDASPDIDLRLGVAVLDLVAEDGGVRVETDAGPIRARHVVDTRPREAEALMYQCFSGVELETRAACDFDPGEVGLMTSMTASRRGFGFLYVLPLAPDRALVEWTRFSEEPLSTDVVSDERDTEITRLGLSGARVIRTEGGVLGMGQSRVRSDGIPGVVVAGVAGGALRAASGFGFLRIQQWADACATSVVRHGTPIGHPAEPPVRREMDRIFLQAIAAHPGRTAGYFMGLASGVGADRLVRFLSDQATLADYVHIIASLPLAPFLAQIPARRRLPHPIGVAAR